MSVTNKYYDKLSERGKRGMQIFYRELKYYQDYELRSLLLSKYTIHLGAERLKKTYWQFRLEVMTRRIAKLPLQKVVRGIINLQILTTYRSENPNVTTT